MVKKYIFHNTHIKTILFCISFCFACCQNVFAEDKLRFYIDDVPFQNDNIANISKIFTSFRSEDGMGVFYFDKSISSSFKQINNKEVQFIDIKNNGIPGSPFTVYFETNNKTFFKILTFGSTSLSSSSFIESSPRVDFNKFSNEKNWVLAVSIDDINFISCDGKPFKDLIYLDNNDINVGFLYYKNGTSGSYFTINNKPLALGKLSGKCNGESFEIKVLARRSIGNRSYIKSNLK